MMTLTNKIRFFAGLPFFLLGLLFLKGAAAIASDDGACKMGDWFLAEDAPDATR